MQVQYIAFLLRELQPCLSFDDQAGILPFHAHLPYVCPMPDHHHANDPVLFIISYLLSQLVYQSHYDDHRTPAPTSHPFCTPPQQHPSTRASSPSSLLSGFLLHLPLGRTLRLPKLVWQPSSCRCCGTSATLQEHHGLYATLCMPHLACMHVCHTMHLLLFQF